MRGNISQTRGKSRCQRESTAGLSLSPRGRASPEHRKERPVTRFWGLLEIRPSERGLVGLLLLHSLALGVVRVATETAATALFVQRYGASWLPLTLIGAALANPLVCLGFERLGSRLGFRRLITVSLGLLALATLVFYALMQGKHAWPSLWLVVFFHSTYLVTGLEFWGLCGRLLDLRQAKRLLGLIGAGELMAQVALGLSIPLFLKVFATADLLLLSLLGLLVCLSIARRLANACGPEAREPEDAALAGRELLRDGYVRVLLGVTAGATVCSYLLYQIFYDVAALHYTDESRLAGFVGLYQAAAGALALAMGSLATSHLLDRFGLAAGLLCFPIGVVGVGGLVAGLALTGGAAPLLFGAVVLLKLQEDTLFDSLYRPSYQTLRQPLAPGRRLGVQALSEGWVEPLVGGLTGLLLLGLTQGLHLGAGAQACLLVAFALAWAGGCHRLVRDYRGVLMESLARRRLTSLPAPDPALRRKPAAQSQAGSAQVLADALKSSHPGELIYLLKLMKDVSPPVWERGLLQNLAHPSPEVRQHVLREIEARQLEKALPALIQRLQEEQTPRLRGDLVRTLACLSVEQAAPWLESPVPPVRLGAMVGLLKCGQLEGILLAGEHLLRLIESPAAESRRLACEVLGEVANPGLYRSLQRLLADADPGVRSRALLAAGQVASPRLWPVVVEALDDPVLRPAASLALKRGGNSVLPFLGQPDHRRLRIAGALPGGAGLSYLEQALLHPSRSLRQLALTLWTRHPQPAPAALVEALYAQLRREEEGLALCLRARHDLGTQPDLHTLVEALNYQVQIRRSAILMIVSLLFDPEVMQTVRLNLSDRQSAASRAAALEVLDGLLPRTLKARLLPLLEEEGGPLGEWTWEQRLQDILAADPETYSPWISSLARQLTRRETTESMLTPVEKVLILKKVSVFQETPDEVLVEVAEALEELDLPAGRQLFSAGEVGNRMYIVVFGQVQVHRGEEVLNQLGQGEVFGEMSLLDSEPRTASVRTLEDTRLLQLSQERLYELMADHPPVMRGIIRYLTGHLRDHLKA